MEVIYVDSAESLQSASQRFSKKSVIAVDTEFMREKTYYAQLCLLQIASDDLIACIDPLAFDNIDPILDVIYDPNIVKILHSARQDLEVLFDIRQSLPPRIHDSQIAATFLGLGDQIGYGALVQEVFNIELAKSQTRTDWSRRPLDANQLSYAADDVRYLIEAYDIQIVELKEKGYLEWAMQDFSALSNTSLFMKPDEDLWQRVKNWQTLRGSQLAVLQALAIWREHLAKQQNRPRRWTLADSVLVTIAELLPNSLDELVELLPASTFERYGDEVLSIISQSKTIVKEKWPVAKGRLDLTKEQSSQVKNIMSQVKELAEQRNLVPSIIASRKDIEHVVLGHSNSRILSGWRQELMAPMLSS